MAGLIVDTAYQIARKAIGKAAFAFLPDSKFLCAYRLGAIDGEILLAHLKEKGNKRTTNLAFNQYTGPAQKQLVGIVYLKVIDDQLCFLLVERSASSGISKAYYAFPAGRRNDRENPGERDIWDDGDLGLRGLVTEDEKKLPLRKGVREGRREAFFHAAARRGEEKSGIIIYYENVIGRIEFKGMQPGVKISLFLADTEYGCERSGLWVPIDTLRSPQTRVLAFLAQRGKPEIGLMPSLEDGGLQQLADWFTKRAGPWSLGNII